MKIINSHYIPLAEPHNIIMGPGEDDIAEQIGVISVVEENPTADGGYGIMTHEHPVVRSLRPVLITKETKESIEVFSSVAMADGDVWYYADRKDCMTICPVNHRRILSFKLNSLMMGRMLSTGCDYDPMGMINIFKEFGIEVVWPEEAKQNHQEIILSNMRIGDKMYLNSLMTQPLFLVYFADIKKEKRMRLIDDDDIFFEFVNQARAMLELNPHFDFHFTTIDNQMEYMAERLNKELNDYLERPNESE